VRSPRNRGWLAGTGAVIVVAVVGIGFLLASTTGALGGASSNSSSVATTTPPSAASTTTAPPLAADVTAAKACEAFNVYLADAAKGGVSEADGQALINAAGTLLDGAQADQAAGRPLPKWAGLGEDLVNAAQDIVNSDTTAFKTDGPEAAEACQTIPVSARLAGGYLPDPTAPTLPAASSASGGAG
jgi:hypothetical protein